MKMSLSSAFSTILALIGSVLLLISLFSGAASIQSLIERQQHGAGPLFADVELFGFVALICAVAGGLAFFGARKLSKRKQANAS